MDFQTFKNSKRVVSTDLYVEENNVANRDFLGITEDADYVVQYPSGVFMEMHSDGQYYMCIERSEYYSNHTSLDDMERELYIWAVTELSFDDLDLEDFIMTVSYQASDKPRAIHQSLLPLEVHAYEYVVDMLDDEFVEMPTDTLDEMYTNLSAIGDKLKSENNSLPLLSEILTKMGRALDEKYASQTKPI